MTKKELIGLLEAALEAARAGDDEILDRCMIELVEEYVDPEDKAPKETDR